MEPRKRLIVGADVVRGAEGSTEAPQMAWRGGPIGVGEQGMGTGGSPGTWETLPFPQQRPDEGDRFTNPRPVGGSARPYGSE